MATQILASIGAAMQVSGTLAIGLPIWRKPFEFDTSSGFGDENDVADLVEYLNSPNNGSNPNGGINWAAERAKNGHPSPYNVKYFGNIGNNTYTYFLFPLY